MRNAVFLALAFTLVPAAADVGEGNWELEVTTSMPGMAAGGATAKQTQCLSADDARDPSKLFGAPGTGCQFSHRRDDGSTYRFDIACSGATPLSGSGEMRYSRDTLDGDIVIRMGAGAQSMETRSRIRARRLGPCK